MKAAAWATGSMLIHLVFEGLVTEQTYQVDKLTIDFFGQFYDGNKMIQYSYDKLDGVKYSSNSEYTDIPLLIIHGDEDMKAPLSMAYKLYDSCNGEKQLYIVHGADHTENYRKDPGGYEKIVTKFIEERLRQKKCQTPGTKP